MGLSVRTITTGLGITTHYGKLRYGKLEDSAKQAVEELAKIKDQDKKFLKWVSLPEKQLERVDYIYKKVEEFKNQTSARFLSIIGIGGSKHPIEHMLSINGLNLDKKIKFISDIDTVSINRFMQEIEGNPRNSRYLVVSKSGTTFEPKDALIRTKNAIKGIFTKDGYSEQDAQNLTSKYFVAVTDANSKTSELRRTANEENWLGKFFIHDDVGGRFSAFDDHTLFTLAYAGMKKEDMKAMLLGAQGMTKNALSKNIEKNDPLTQAVFWVQAKMQGINTTVHQYLGSMFENTVNWHAQMQNESLKHTLKQITKVPDAMHHSAEAHFNTANKYAFALTSPNDKGLLSENLNGYVDALSKSYRDAGPYFNEVVDVNELGLTPQAAGALTQSRAFSTVYQEIIEKINAKQPLPDVLDSVLQPFVETYKKNLKPSAVDKPVVVAGRTLNKQG